MTHPFYFFNDENFKLKLKNFNYGENFYQIKKFQKYIKSSEIFSLLMLKQEIFLLNFLKIFKKIEKINYKFAFYSNKLYTKSKNILKLIILDNLSIMKKKFFNFFNKNLENLDLFVKNIFFFKKNFKNLLKNLLGLKKIFFEIILQEFSKNFVNINGKIKNFSKKKNFFNYNFSFLNFLQNVFTKVYFSDNKEKNIDLFFKIKIRQKINSIKPFLKFFFNTLLENLNFLHFYKLKKTNRKNVKNIFYFLKTIKKLKNLLNSIIFDLNNFKISINNYLNLLTIFKKKNGTLKNFLQKTFFFSQLEKFFFHKKKIKEKKLNHYRSNLNFHEKKWTNYKNFELNVYPEDNIKQCLQIKNKKKFAINNNKLMNKNYNFVFIDKTFLNSYLNRTRFLNLNKEFSFFWKLIPIKKNQRKIESINKNDRKNKKFYKKTNLKIWKNLIFLKKLFNKLKYRIKKLNLNLNKKIKIEMNYLQKIQEIKTMQIDLFFFK
jgi:hypothetical protein